MKYFIDTEFIEGPQKESFPISLFRKQTPPTIDLISIGIVSEDGRELYEISKEFNLKEAWNRFQINNDSYPTGVITYWLRENVLYPIWKELFLYQECDYALLNNRESDKFKAELDADLHKKLFSYKSLKGLLAKHGKTNKQIAKKIKRFVFQTDLDNKFKNKPLRKPIEFCAYYADYDWVVFCWLFGKMIDLPKGFPKYCNDLKQTFEELQKKYNSMPPHPSNIKNQILKNNPDYPKQENQHNAIADARWNKKLYDFLNSLE